MSCLFPPCLLLSSQFRKSKWISPLIPLLGPSLWAGAWSLGAEPGTGVGCGGLGQVLDSIDCRLLLCGAVTGACLVESLSESGEMMPVKCSAYRKPSLSVYCHSHPRPPAATILSLEYPSCCLPPQPPHQPQKSPCLDWEGKGGRGRNRPAGGCCAVGSFPVSARGASGSLHLLPSLPGNVSQGCECSPAPLSHLLPP